MLHRLPRRRNESPLAGFKVGVCHPLQMVLMLVPFVSSVRSAEDRSKAKPDEVLGYPLARRRGRRGGRVRQVAADAPSSVTPWHAVVVPAELVRLTGCDHRLHHKQKSSLDGLEVSKPAIAPSGSVGRRPRSKPAWSSLRDAAEARCRHRFRRLQRCAGLVRSINAPVDGWTEPAPRRLAGSTNRRRAHDRCRACPQNLPAQTRTAQGIEGEHRVHTRLPAHQCAAARR